MERYGDNMAVRITLTTGEIIEPADKALIQKFAAAGMLADAVEIPETSAESATYLQDAERKADISSTPITTRDGKVVPVNSSQLGADRVHASDVFSLAKMYADEDKARSKGRTPMKEPEYIDYPVQETPRAKLIREMYTEGGMDKEIARKRGDVDLATIFPRTMSGKFTQSVGEAIDDPSLSKVGRVPVEAVLTGAGTALDLLSIPGRTIRGMYAGATAPDDETVSEAMQKTISKTTGDNIGSSILVDPLTFATMGTPVD